MTAPTVTTAAASYLALDAAYRAATAKTSLAVARVLLGYWRLVDPNELSRTAPDWLANAVQIVLNGQTRASGLANAYTEQVRRLSVPDASPFAPVNPRPPNVEQVRTSLEFTGIKTTARELYALERSVQRGEDLAEEESEQRTLQGRQKQLMDAAIQRAVGAAIRHITTAGRDQLEDNVLADETALGWVRTTKAGCCYFCAMLASRGIVYKGDSFEFSNQRFRGAGEQKVHDFCGCGLRPVYTNGDPLPERVDELDTMWGESQKQVRPGETPINAFRRMYEASTLWTPSEVDTA